MRDAETWENSPTQKWFWNCHPLILNPVQSDRHVIDTIFGLVLHLFNLIHSTGFFWMDGVLRPRAHAFLHSLVSLRIQLYSLISLLAVSVVVLNALRSHSNFYSVTIYLSKSSRSVLVRLFPYMLIKCVWAIILLADVMIGNAISKVLRIDEWTESTCKWMEKMWDTTEDT